MLICCVAFTRFFILVVVRFVFRDHRTADSIPTKYFVLNCLIRALPVTSLLYLIVPPNIPAIRAHTLCPREWRSIRPSGAFNNPDSEHSMGILTALSMKQNESKYG